MASTVGFRNGDLVLKNITFDYTVDPTDPLAPAEPGVITADGQLLIGSVTTHPNVAMQAGFLTSTGGTVTITYDDPNINLESAAAVPVSILTSDGPVSPVLGQFDFTDAGGNVIVGSPAPGFVTFDASPVLDLLTFHLVVPVADVNPASGIINFDSAGGSVTMTQTGPNTINFEAAAGTPGTILTSDGPVSPVGGQYDFTNAGGNVIVGSTAPGVVTFDASPVLDLLTFHLVVSTDDVTPASGIVNFDSVGGTVTITKTGANTINFESAGGGGGTLNTLTPDSGGPVSPTVGNINVLGLPILAGQTRHLQTSTSNVGASTLQVKAPNCCLFIVDANPLYGTHTTIQSAINDATLIGTAQYVFIRPGTYIENLTMLPRVSLVNFECEQNSPKVVIVGQITVSANVSASIANIVLSNAVGPLVTMTAGGIFLTLLNCIVFPQGANGFNVGAGGSLIMEGCTGSIVSNLVTFFTINGGAVSMQDCIMYNTVASAVQNTVTNGNLLIGSTIFQAPITSTGTCAIAWSFCEFETGFGLNATCYNANCTGGSTTEIYNCQFQSGTATSIICGAGNVTLVQDCTVQSANAAAISGAGEIRYTPINFNGLSTTVTTTTQTPIGALGPRVPVGQSALQLLSGAGSPNGVVTAPKGSMFLRTDGTTTNNRAYINTNGATTWTAIITVA